MKRFLVTLSAALFVAEFLLLVVSWLLSATMTSGVRSLLSGEGIRWLLGRFVDTLQTPLLVWLLLLSMAYGCLRGCGCLQRAVNRSSDRVGRNRYRLLAPFSGATFVTVLAVAMLLVLFLQPQAVLLSATGSLWPSPFSRGLIPLLALLCIVFAVSYGVLSGAFSSLSDVFQSLVDGIAASAPLFVVYVLGVQLVASFFFVLGG